MNHETRHVTTRFLVMSACVLLVVMPAWAQEDSDSSGAHHLWRYLGPGEAAANAIDATVDSRRVEVAASILEGAPERLVLDLSSGTRYHARLRHVEWRGPGDLVWRGDLEEMASAQVNLTLAEGYILGLIDTPEGLFELRTTRDGDQELAKLDPSRFPECANEVYLGDDRTVSRGTMSAPAVPLLDEPESIDVMGLYTPQARDAAGGVAAIEALIQAAVDDANTSFLNSDMVPRFNLVHVEQADYNDSGDIFADRNWAQADPAVRALRDQHAADLVSLFVETSPFCGVAFLMGNEDPVAFGDFAYQVTVRPCAVGNHTYSHEHGHNMGMQHNPENGAPPSSAVFPHAYGHYVDGSFRTVMSSSSPCGSGCDRVNQFSNPDVLFKGVPTGIADQRDNHLTGNLIALFTANYRIAGLIFSDGFESGDTSAW